MSYQFVGILMLDMLSPRKWLTRLIRKKSVRRLPKKQQKGAALIIVLVVTSLVAIAAVAVSEQTQLSIYLTQNQQDSLQAERYLHAAEQHAIILLDEALDTPTIHLQQEWASTRSEFEIEQGRLNISITDLRSCFNLNVIADQVEERAGLGLASKEVTRLRSLLRQLQIPGATQNLFIYRLKDWVDPNNEISQPYGAEDQVYLNAKPGYKVADAPLAGLDEVALLKVNHQHLSALLPFICVLPVGAGNRLNLNTVSQPELLVALSEGVIDLNYAESIIAARPTEGYQSLSEVINSQNKMLQTTIAAMPLTLTSSFFRADLQVHYGRSIKRRSVFIQFVGEKAQVYKRVNRDE